MNSNPSPYEFLEGVPSEDELYYVPTNSFGYQQPPVPCHFFATEREEVMEFPRKTKIVNLDLGETMDFCYPATTPNLLVRYISIAASASLVTRFEASTEIYCVLAGKGKSSAGGRTIDWREGDVFVFPGGKKVEHIASSEGALLYEATDEPLLSFTGLTLPHSDNSRCALYYPVGKINEHLDRTHGRPDTNDEVAKSVFFTSRRLQGMRTTTPWIATNINTLEAGKDQRAHRHNAAAVTLSIDGEGVYSMVGDRQVNWERFGVMVTPPSELHSHHNRGLKRMRSFVVQDSGIYYYSRTTGFSFG